MTLPQRIKQAFCSHRFRETTTVASRRSGFLHFACDRCEYVAHVRMKGHWQDICYDCGSKAYFVIRPDMLDHITAHLDACQSCGKVTAVIPASDWKNACRVDREPNYAELD